MKRATVSTKAAMPRPVLREPVLAYVARAGLDEHFQTHGMYPPQESSREGAAAFTLRADVRLGALLETVEQLLRQSEGIAAAIARDESVNATTSAAAEGLRYLLQQARGLHSLVHQVVHRAVIDDSAAVSQGGAS